MNQRTEAMQSYSRILLLALTVAIDALSVVPPGWRPVTGVPHGLEHAVIFGLAGASLALSFARSGLVLGIVAVMFTALIEVAQVWIPGRHARLSDFVVDTHGAWLGLCLGAMGRRLWRSRGGSAMPIPAEDQSS
jgi:VanZ family protein